MKNFNNKKERAIRGSFWSAIDRFSVLGIQFVVSIILARLLMPDEFAIIAIATIFNVIFQTINEAGLGTALVYKLDRDDKDFSTVFFSNIFIAIFSYLIVYFISIPIADFYQIPLLVPVMRLLGLNLIISSLGIVQLTKFVINVDFKKQAQASLISVIISGILGVVAALLFKNVYAIVLQSLSFQIVNVICVWRLSRWTPSFCFSCKRFLYIFNYAYKLILARLISVVFDDLYSLAIGKIFSASSLGCYNRANSFMLLSSRNIINIIQRVSIPLLCEEQNSNTGMQRVMLKFMSSTALIVYPMLAGLMLLSKPLILVLLTDKWALSSEILLYICPIGFFYLISTFNRNIYNATGKTGVALKIEIFKKSMFVAIFFIAIHFDFRLVLLSQIFISIIEMIIDMYNVRVLIGLKFSSQFGALKKVLLSTFIMSLCMYFVLSLISNIYLELFLGIFVGLIVYAYSCYLFKMIDFKKIFIYIK